MSSFEILNTLPFIGVLVVEERKIIFANREMKDILGWPPEDLKGKSLRVIFSEEAYVLFLEALARIEKREAIKVRMDAICLHRNEENIYCFFSLTTSLEEGWIVVTVQDAAGGGLITDSLTGLYNRRAFLTLANHEIETAKRFKRELFVVAADVDGLKKVNDRFGHAAGDELLRAATEILRATFRKSDIIARVGGDEFAVLALGEPGTVELLMARLEGIAEITNRESLARYGFMVSLSAGAVRYNPDCLFHLALKEADEKMYEKKRAKKEKRR